MQYNTIEEAQAYMDGVVTTREEITKMITLEIEKRKEPPVEIKHWTKYLVALINKNDKSEEEILEECARDFATDLGIPAEVADAIHQLNMVMRKLAEENEEEE